MTLLSILVSTGLSLCLEFFTFSQISRSALDQKRPHGLPHPAVSCGGKIMNQDLIPDATVTQRGKASAESSGGKELGEGTDSERRGQGKGWSQAARSSTPTSLR